MFRQSSLPFPPPITETPPQQPSSSSPPPVKSHPLHNFPLSDLRWSMNHNNTHHRLRKSSAAVRSPVKAIDEDASSSELKPDKNGSGSKILIRIRTKNNETDGERISDDEFGAKSWNLRPRKPPPTKKRSIGNGNGVVLKRCAEVAKGTVRTEAIRSRNGADAKMAMVAERKEKNKPRLTISLSKLEIDEDIYALTGSKPSRRPKKRAKNLQKQLDVLFPGLWMGNVSSDAYKVSDHA